MYSKQYLNDVYGEKIVSSTLKEMGNTTGRRFLSSKHDEEKKETNRISTNYYLDRFLPLKTSL